MTLRLILMAVLLVVLASAPCFAQDGGNKVGGRIAPFLYVPTGGDFSGGNSFNFQPFIVFEDDFNLYGANLVFAGAGNGFYFPVAAIDLDGGDTGVLFGAGFNKFFESGAENGRWLGDVSVTHATEVDTTSLNGAFTHVWYTGGAVTYLGARINAGFGDSDGFGYGAHGGVKFPVSKTIVLELQGAFRTFDGDSAGSVGASVGIGF